MSEDWDKRNAALDTERSVKQDVNLFLVFFTKKLQTPLIVINTE